MQTPPRIFDRILLRYRRDRAAARLSAHDFLFAHAAQEIAERLSYLRYLPKLALDLGAHTGQLSRALPHVPLVQMDLSQAMLTQAKGLRVVGDEELLPFAPASFDAAFSALSLHWVNDVPGTLAQLNRCLKPRSLLIAIVFGTQTLHALRTAFEEAELHARGGVHPRVSPFMDVRDVAQLASRAGFKEPVVDSDVVEVRYDDVFSLFDELKGMGENNALVERDKHVMPRSLFREAVERYPLTEGQAVAQFELVTLTAWSS